jgi:hypothetical protein
MSRAQGCRAVLEVMEDGGWHYLPHIATAAGLSQTGCSARIRDLRKAPLFLQVECKPAPIPGPFLYRIPCADMGVASRARQILDGKG